RGKGKGAPSHCPPDSVPIVPRQGRSPITCPPDRVPPFPLISGGFALACSTGHVHPVNYSSRLLAWPLFYEKCTYDSVYTHAQSYPFLAGNACEQRAYHLLACFYDCSSVKGKINASNALVCSLFSC